MVYVSPHPRAPLIAVEGVDGTGKTTVVKRLVEHFHAHGIALIATRAPGDPAIGELGRRLRHLLLNEGHLIKDPYTRQMLFLADHTELISQVILPHLEQGIPVITDRFLASTMAYAVGGGGLDQDRMWAMCQAAIPRINRDTPWQLPQHTILLVANSATARERVLTARGAQDEADRLPDDFYRHVAEYYTAMSFGRHHFNHRRVPVDPARTSVVNTNIPLDHVLEYCIEIVTQVIERHPSALYRTRAQDYGF